MSERSGYSLNAVCLHCNRFGTVDDGSMVCVNCGNAHEPTAAQISRRNADMMLTQVFKPLRESSARADAAIASLPPSMVSEEISGQPSNTGHETLGGRVLNWLSTRGERDA